MCDLPAFILQQLGSVSYGLTVEDIECLKEIDEDNVAALGSLPGWTQQQVRENIPILFVGWHHLDNRIGTRLLW